MQSSDRIKLVQSACDLTNLTLKDKPHTDKDVIDTLDRFIALLQLKSEAIPAALGEE